MDSNIVLCSLQRYFQPLGLETHAFKVAWYNETVSPAFKLPYDGDTIAYVVISAPSMFEKAFVPYVKARQTAGSLKFDRDPLDECMKFHFHEASKLLPGQEAVLIQDFELLPDKRPKILVQTAAHVAGCAYYYQKSDAEAVHGKDCPCNASDSDPSSRIEAASSVESCTCEKPWDRSKRVYGVCINPDYGGWFAIRGVMIYPGLNDPSLQRPDPPDCVATRSERIELLNRFNGNWKDWSYRDIIPVKERYSELQKKYFATLPKDRHSLLEHLLNYDTTSITNHQTMPREFIAGF